MNDRQEEIYRILSKHGNASIEQLKREIFASEATLRRDLTQMEQEGLLIRTWGGAVISGKADSDPPLFVRSNANVRAKNSIAKAAAEFMDNNMTVFLASGTTVVKFAKYLQKFENLTVITNGLDIVNALTGHLSAKIIILGGELYENYDLIGTLTDSTIEQFNADIFFFSCSGITAEGFSSKDMTRLNIIKKMNRNSSKTVLLADTSKVGKRYTYKGFDFDEIDHVIMEETPQDLEITKVLGKKLIIAK